MNAVSVEKVFHPNLDLQSAMDILESRPDWKHEDIGAELDRDFFSQPGKHGLIGATLREDHVDLSLD